MGRLLSYTLAKIKSKFFGRAVMIKYFRKQGIQMGDNVNCFSDIVTPEPYLISIGKNTVISYDVDFITHDNSLSKLGIGYSDSFGKITIGENCFIGAHTIVLPGVTIGDNCIIGAGSVVTRSVESGSVGGGNPFIVQCTINDFKERCIGKYFSIDNLNFNEKKNRIFENLDKLKRR